MNAPTRLSPEANIAAKFVLAALLVFAFFGLVPAAQSATWPAGSSLVSGSLAAAPAYQSLQPASAVTISNNGRYGFFISSASALSPDAPNGALFRKDMHNDAAPLKVVAKLLAPVSGVQCGVAGRPSVSSDGRFVAFASGENGLVAADTNGRRDVFVRDMNVAIGAAGAYELASALDGAATGASYELVSGAGTEIPAIPAAENCLYGAELPGTQDSALSNDGQKVLFTNTAFTNLSADAGNTTAPGQLFVRDRGAAPGDTTLVTSIAHDIPYEVPLLPEPVQDVGDPLPDQEYFETGADDDESNVRSSPIAALSGDGTTVVWSGTFARNQVEYHGQESLFDVSVGGPFTWELMWRRVADGALAETRRVSGWVDLDDPACNPNLGSFEPGFEPETPGEQACAGPLRNEVIKNCPEPRPAALSDDGNKVFFLSCANTWADLNPMTRLDLFISNMAPGVSRKAGFQMITKSVGSGDSGIIAMAASGDGNRALISTERRVFSNSGLVEVSPFPAPSTTTKALFLVDGSGAGGFTGAPIEWVGRPTSGNDLSAAVNDDFALDGDGDTITFASAATQNYAGHNGIVQALCQKKSGPCVTNAPPAPTASISGPANGSTVGSPVTASYTTSGATSVTCQWDSETVLNPCPASPLAAKTLSPGAHTFTVNAIGASETASAVSAFTVGSPPPPPVQTDPPAASAPAPTPSVNALKSVIKPTAAVISIDVVGAGALKATGTAKLPKGKKLKPMTAGSGSATVAGSGTVQLDFKLNAAAKKYLKKKGKLAVTVKLQFTPNAGAAIEKTVQLSFKSKKKK